MNALFRPLATSALCLLLFASLPATAQQPQGLPAEVHRVETSTLVNTLRAVGTLRANESVMLRPEISGRITEIVFKEGEAVEANQPLFRIDSARYEAELAQAQAQAHLSRVEYQRAADLLERRVGSQTDRDTRLAHLRVAEAQVEVARTQLNKATIRAPFAGIAGLRHVSPGDFVNVGQDLVELTDYSRMKVDFTLPERNLSQLAVGQRISLEVDALPGQVFEGEIYAIAPSSNPRSHNLSLRAYVPNPDGILRPGLFAQISIITGENPAALVIPEQAIIPEGTRFLVMRVDEENRVSLTPVTLGTRLFGKVQILSGIAPGDVVVTAGHIKLRPGMPITPLFTSNSEAGGA